MAAKFASWRTPIVVLPPVETLRLRGGSLVTVRSAGPGDGDIIQSYIRGLSPGSRRNRFLGALNELSAVELYRMTHSDHRQFALIAETVADGARTMIGEARGALAPDGLSAEVALSVAEAWRRKTLGTQLLGVLAHRARGLGVDYLTAEVLRSNEAITALAQKVGFRVAPPAADARLMQLITNISLPGLERTAPGRESTLSIAGQ
jgi:GNAT superfamily N-acetyltransferase